MATTKSAVSSNTLRLLCVVVLAEGLGVELPPEVEFGVLPLVLPVALVLPVELPLGQSVVAESDVPALVDPEQLLFAHVGSDAAQSVVLLLEHAGSVAGSQRLTLPEGGLLLLMQTEPQPVLEPPELADDPDDVLPLVPVELLPPPVLLPLLLPPVLPPPVLPLPPLEGGDALFT